jgi:hypothetical protein
MMNVTQCRLAALLSCVGVLFGCSTQGAKIVENSRVALTQGTPVNSYAALSAQKVAFTEGNDTVQMRVDMVSAPDALQRLQLPEQPLSFAKLFELPAWTEQYSVRITSVVLGSDENQSVYYPRLVFLDSEFKPVRTSTQGDFRFRGFGNAGALSANMFVNESNTKERYVAVVEEPRKSVEEQLSLIKFTSAPTPMILPWQGKILELLWVVSSTRDEPPRRLNAANAGVYEINFTRYKPRKLGE